MAPSALQMSRIPAGVLGSRTPGSLDTLRCNNSPLSRRGLSCAPRIIQSRTRNITPSAVSSTPSAPGFHTLSSLDLDIDTLTWESQAACEQCRYPCHLSGRHACGASEYLAMWAEEEHAKPTEFDVEHNLPLNSGAEVAVVSFGGRNGPKWKTENQDSFLVHALPHTEGTAHAPFIVGVFDGHGSLGKKVSHGVRDAMAAKLSSLAAPMPGPTDTASSHEDWLTASFAHAADTVDSMGEDFSKSGAAAVVCSVDSSRVTAAWAGDCRAVLGVHAPASDGSSTGSVRAVLPLTRDHKPDPLVCPSEAERILACGGRIDRLAADRQGNPIGPFRIFLADAWTPGLALSRAFGDTLARPVGVISTPDVNSLVLPSPGWAGEKAEGDVQDSRAARHVLIVASDGLWEWISSETAADVAWKMPTAKSAAQALAEIAKKEWAISYRGRACDDITVAVAFIPA